MFLDYAILQCIIINIIKNWPRGYKTFFMLSSVENEI